MSATGHRLVLDPDDLVISVGDAHEDQAAVQVRHGRDTVRDPRRVLLLELDGQRLSARRRRDVGDPVERDVGLRAGEQGLPGSHWVVFGCARGLTAGASTMQYNGDYLAYVAQRAGY
jgi:hypothetical protein